MWISIEQIRCLNEVAAQGSVHSASLKLNKAKSAINYSINKLEEQLSFKVLDRSSYRTKLTHKGLLFLEKAKPLLKESTALTESAKQIASGVETKVTMSATALYPTEKLNTVMSNVLKKFESTEFIFHKEILSGEKMLREGLVDIAIFENLNNTLDFDYKPIGSVDLKLVVSSEHELLTYDSISEEDLMKFPQIVQRSTIPDDYSVGVKENALKWTVSDLASKKELIIAGLGWGRLPSHEIESELNNGSLSHLENLKQDHRVDICICKHKDKDVGAVTQYIWDSF